MLNLCTSYFCIAIECIWHVPFHIKCWYLLYCYMTYFRHSCATYVESFIQVIRVTMTAFELENEIDCAYDYVELSDSSGYLSGRLCGDRDPVIRTRLESPVTVTFHTDWSVTLAGFTLHYEALYGEYDSRSV